MSDAGLPRAGRAWVGRGAATWLALRALRAYKLLISPLFSGACRYLPSCADYAAEAIERHGVAAGVGLCAHRLCRCHPFGGSGHDPVPESNPWRSLFVGRKRGGAGPSSPARTDART